MIRTIVGRDRIDMVTWKVETSHMVAVPECIKGTSIFVVRNAIQAIADSKKVREDRPAIGPLTYRYEMDEDDTITVIHSYFEGKDGKLRRFMRLRREA